MNKIIETYLAMDRFQKIISWILVIGFLIAMLGSVADGYTFGVSSSIGFAVVAINIAVFVADIAINANKFPFNGGKNIFVSLFTNMVAYILVWFFLAVGFGCISFTFGKTIDVFQPYLGISAIFSLIVLIIWPVRNYYKSLS